MSSLPARKFFARADKSTARLRLVRATVALVTTALIAGPMLATSPAIAAPLTVDLGAATGYSVLGHETVTNTGNTIVGGDLGVSPGTAVTGFPPGMILANGGRFHSADDSAAAAQTAVTTAYNDAMGRTPSGAVVGIDYQLGGQTFTPGVYASSSSAQISGTVTLDGQGNPNAVFIFQMGSTLTTSAGSPSVPASIVRLTNGARAANVFWAVGSSATLGTYSYFAGTVLALASVTVTTGAHINGRTFARTAAVTLDTDYFATPPSFSPTIAITSPASTTSVTPTIFGTVSAPTGSTVSVSITPVTGSAATVQATVTGGTWSAASPTLVGGAYTVVATVTEPDGSTGTDTRTLTVDHTGPAVTITAPGYTNNPTPTIAGTITAPTGSTVAVTVKSLSGAFVETQAAPVSGTTWTTSPKLEDGSYSVDATVTSPDNETGSAIQQSLTVYTETPVVTIAPLGLTNNPMPTISGTVTAPNGSTVTVRITPTAGAAIILPATVTGNVWTVTPSALTDGSYTVNATVTDPAGNAGNAAPRTLTVDATAPVVTIAQLGTTNNPTPKITGTANVADGSIVTVTIMPAVGPAKTVLAIATGGSWSLTAPMLVDGTYSVGATATDEADNIGNASPRSLTVDTVIPLIRITSGNPTNNPTPTISGTVTAPTGSMVGIVITPPTGPSFPLMATITGGTWSVAVPKLADGTYGVVATVTTPANNTANATQGLVVDATAPIVRVNPLGLTNNPVPMISGTTNMVDGRIVSVTITPLGGGTPLMTSAIVQGSAWSVVAPRLVDGSYTVGATGTDKAGNTGTATPQTLTVDTNAPVVTIAPLGMTNDPTPKITGTAKVPDGAVVSVTITPYGGTPITVPTTVTSGVWTITAPKLTDGTYAVGASSTDPAGNIGRAVPQALKIDTVAPMVTITPQGLVNSSIPTIKGTANVPDGTVVTVTVAPYTGESHILTATVTGGAWSLVAPKLDDGTYTIGATAADPAGNIGRAETQTLTIDTIAPGVTIAPLGLTNNPTPKISGTAGLQDGAVVTITLTSATGNPVFLTATVVGGAWKVTAPNLADGLYTVTATAVDPAGNIGSATPQSLTIKTVKPAIKITSPGGATIAVPTIFGTTDAPIGSVVTVTVDGVVLSPSPVVTGASTLAVTSVAALSVRKLRAVVVGGTWTILSTKLKNGIHTVVATVTDPAGNAGTDAQNLTITSALATLPFDPPAIVITSAATSAAANPTISGTTFDIIGSVITVSVDGVNLPTTAPTAAGTWSVVSRSLPVGSHAVVATIVNSHGSASDRQTLVIDPQLSTLAITPAEAALAATGGNLSGELWGLVFVILGSLALLGRSVNHRRKAASNL